MKSVLKKTVALLSVGAITAMLSGCYFLPDEEEVLPPPTVKTSEVKYTTIIAARKDLVKQVVTAGTVQSATVNEQYFSDQGGVIKAIYVAPGDVVAEGDLIAELETYDLDEQIETQQLYVRRAELTHQIAVEQGYSQAEIDKAALDIQLEENDLAKLYEQKENAKLYATSSGTVSDVTSKGTGEYVNVGESLAKVIDVTDLYINIFPTDLTVYKLNDEVTIRIDGAEYPGYVSRSVDMISYEETIDEKYFVEIKFNTADNESRIVGNLVDVILVLDRREDVVVVSNNLIKNVNGQDVVYVLEDGRKVERAVEVGLQTGSESEIISGLSEGDEIVIR